MKRFIASRRLEQIEQRGIKEQEITQRIEVSNLTFSVGFTIGGQYYILGMEFG